MVSRSNAETPKETSRQESHISTSHTKDTQQTTQTQTPEETLKSKKIFFRVDYEELPIETFGEHPPLEYLTGFTICQHPD